MDWTTIIISIVGAIAVSIVTGIITVNHSQKKFLSENAKADIEKAISMAEIYATELIPLLDYVTALYGANKPLMKAQEKLSSERKMGNLKFTHAEMQTLFDKKELAKIKDEMQPLEMDCGTLYAIECKATSYLTDEQKNVLFENKTKKLKDLTESHNQLVNTCIINCRAKRTDFLNRLEYFSMYFNTDLANSGVVYQSLHQTFISAVQLMYFDISSRNTDSKDYYFTNVLKLFNKWNEEFNAQIYKETEIRAQKEDDLDGIAKQPTSYKK
ncbi:MAG: hypothetical protein LBN36_04235 [Clostridiales Family XIII bacterium]|jgi:hypothetical protein|nr:hypothetical protein [Clostridiales Family XIII bacterium]